MLANVDTALAASVAESLGIEVPEAQPRATELPVPDCDAAPSDGTDDKALLMAEGGAASVQDALGRFIEAVSAHRFYPREMDPPAV